jgi:hypothetical protein
MRTCIIVHVLSWKCRIWWFKWRINLFCKWPGSKCFQLLKKYDLHSESFFHNTWPRGSLGNQHGERNCLGKLLDNEATLTAGCNWEPRTKEEGLGRWSLELWVGHHPAMWVRPIQDSRTLSWRGPSVYILCSL